MARYPKARIWSVPVVPINSYEEFEDALGDKIEDYEK